MQTLRFFAFFLKKSFFGVFEEKSETFEIWCPLLGVGHM